MNILSRIKVLGLALLLTVIFIPARRSGRSQDSFRVFRMERNASCKSL